MKKFATLLFMISWTHQNIWDNLYSNNAIQSLKQKLPENVKAFLEIENSYLFSNINILYSMDPIKNTFYLNLLYNKNSIGELEINFNEQTFKLYSKKRGCFKTKFPSIFKFNLGNIHNLWKFSTFSEEQNQYEIDLEFLGLNRTKIPQTQLVYKINNEGKQILQSVQMLFITQKLVLVNKLENENEDTYQTQIDQNKFCVEFSFKQLNKKFSDVFLSDLISKLYERLIGYQKQFTGQDQQQIEN